MREILFRGKLLSDGSWMEGNLIIKKFGVCIITPDDTPVGRYGQVDPETVGQYTGLKDKNGKKIFEGDIIKENDVIHNGELQYEGLFFAVVYANGCWFAIRNNRLGERKAMFLGGCCDVSEIIGNIHDHPEMLKGEKANEGWKRMVSIR